mmetsp:Transcript_30064/g.95863  ORF Transcript_30064/g.95863 Transcript_30064/m.95863 type:complete len:282 (+) Transcript_30064:861-1706(+)
MVEQAKLADHADQLAFSPHRAALDSLLLRVLVDPHLDHDVVGAVVDGELQVGVLLFGRHDEANNGDLVQLVPVNREGLLARGCVGGTLQLFDGHGKQRLLVLVALRLAIRAAVVHGVEAASSIILAPLECCAAELVRAPHVAAAAAAAAQPAERLRLGARGGAAIRQQRRRLLRPAAGAAAAAAAAAAGPAAERRRGRPLGPPRRRRREPLRRRGHRHPEPVVVRADQPGALLAAAAAQAGGAAGAGPRYPRDHLAGGRAFRHHLVRHHAGAHAQGLRHGA